MAVETFAGSPSSSVPESDLNRQSTSQARLVLFLPLEAAHARWVETMQGGSPKSRGWDLL